MLTIKLQNTLGETVIETAFLCQELFKHPLQKYSYLLHINHPVKLVQKIMVHFVKDIIRLLLFRLYQKIQLLTLQRLGGFGCRKQPQEVFLKLKSITILVNICVFKKTITHTKEESKTNIPRKKTHTFCM